MAHQDGLDDTIFLDNALHTMILIPKAGTTTDEENAHGVGSEFPPR